MRSSDDKLDELLNAAEWLEAPGATQRLTDAWTKAFRPRRSIGRIVCWSIGFLTAAASVAFIGLAMLRPTAPVRPLTVSLPAPVILSDPPDSVPVDSNTTLSREPTAIERAMLAVSLKQRAKPAIATTRPTQVVSVPPRTSPAVDAVALLRATAGRDRDWREAVCIRLQNEKSPAVSPQVATLLSDPVLRRDAMRVLVRRDDAAARTVLAQAENSPQMRGLLRSVRCEEIQRQLQSRAEPTRVSIPSHVLPYEVNS